MEGKTAHPSIEGGGGGTVSQGRGGKRDASEEPTAPSPVRRTSEEALVKKFSFSSTCGVRGGENGADSATRDYCAVNVLSVESPPLGGVKTVL